MTKVEKKSLGNGPDAIAVVTLRTFALGKLDLLTVLPRETSI